MERGDLEMETEEKVENTDPFPVDKFLEEVGLMTPLDLLFQTFAIQKSRQNLASMGNELAFLFHMIRSKDLKEDNTFPHVAFAERLLPDDPSGPSKFVIWSTEESENWKTRKMLSFNEFHLYFVDVLKPNLNYSAEELYKVLDAKRNESYFISNGPRKSSADEKFHVLFITPKFITTFQFPKIGYDDIPDDQLFICKWVSLTEKCTVRPAFEYAVFEFPQNNLVFSEEEVKEYNENMESFRNAPTPEPECKDCQI